LFGEIGSSRRLRDLRQEPKSVREARVVRCTVEAMFRRLSTGSCDPLKVGVGLEEIDDLIPFPRLWKTRELEVTPYSLRTRTATVVWPTSVPSSKHNTRFEVETRGRADAPCNVMRSAHEELIQILWSERSNFSDRKENLPIEKYEPAFSPFFKRHLQRCAERPHSPGPSPPQE